MTTSPSAAPPTSLDEVKGWFPKIDQRLFTWFLERPTESDKAGDLVELGCYMGKSAILIGRHLAEGQRFTVCDLFESQAPDDSNAKEMDHSYATLTRDTFEANYRAFHEELPEVVQGPTSVILDHVRPESSRFVHVDASHLYEHVHGDIEAARTMLAPGGIVVCDDYRSEHTPGVAAAVWEAVATGGLKPICITTQKLYGTWDDGADAIQDELLAWLDGQEDIWHEVQQVAGRRLLRVKGRWTNKPAAKPKKTDELARVRHELEAVRNSASFKIGRKITALPRALRKS